MDIKVKLRSESQRASWNMLPTDANPYVTDVRRCSSFCLSFPGDQAVLLDFKMFRTKRFQPRTCYLNWRLVTKHCKVLPYGTGQFKLSIALLKFEHECRLKLKRLLILRKTRYSTVLQGMWDSATLRVVALGFFLSLLAWILFQGPLICTAALKGAVACKI